MGHPCTGALGAPLHWSAWGSLAPVWYGQMSAMAVCRRTLTHNTVFIYRLLLNIHNVCGCINIYSVFDPFKSGNVFVLYGVHILVVKVMLCISPSRHPCGWP